MNICSRSPAFPLLFLKPAKRAASPNRTAVGHGQTIKNQLPYIHAYGFNNTPRVCLAAQMAMAAIAAHLEASKGVSCVSLGMTLLFQKRSRASRLYHCGRLFVVIELIDTLDSVALLFGPLHSDQLGTPTIGFKLVCLCNLKPSLKPQCPLG